MPRPDKPTSQFIHARRRAWERFQIPDYSEADEQQIIRQVRGAQAKLAWRDSCRVSVFYVRLRDIDMLAAYDRRSKRVSTLMPLSFAQLPEHQARREAYQEQAPERERHVFRCACGRFSVPAAKRVGHVCGEEI